VDHPMSLWRKRNVQHNGQNQPKWFNMTALANNDLSIKSDDLSIKSSKVIEMSIEAKKQNPVAWQWLTTANFRKKLPKDAEKGAWNPLYITPQQCTWIGLTDEEIFETHKQVDSMQYLTFGKAIEAKLKEKNT
jgi:hypothetical protein